MGTISGFFVCRWKKFSHFHGRLMQFITYILNVQGLLFFMTMGTGGRYSLGWVKVSEFFKVMIEVTFKNLRLG